MYCTEQHFYKNGGKIILSWIPNPCPRNVVNNSQIEKSSPSQRFLLHTNDATHTCISCSSLMLASNSALRVCSSCSCLSPNSSISIRARFWYCSSTCSNTRQQGVEGRREIDGKRRETREIDGIMRERREETQRGSRRKKEERRGKIWVEKRYTLYTLVDEILHLC